MPAGLSTALERIGRRRAALRLHNVLGAHRQLLELCDIVKVNRLRNIATFWQQLGTFDFAIVCNWFCNVSLFFLGGSCSAVSKPIFQLNMLSATVFKLHKICTLLHPSKVNIWAKICWKSQRFSWNFSKHRANVANMICKILPHVKISTSKNVLSNMLQCNEM